MTESEPGDMGTLEFDWSGLGRRVGSSGTPLVAGIGSGGTSVGLSL